MEVGAEPIFFTLFSLFGCIMDSAFFGREKIIQEALIFCALETLFPGNWCWQLDVLLGFIALLISSQIYGFAKGGSQVNDVLSYKQKGVTWHSYFMQA
jgi:hypothetical protein